MKIHGTFFEFHHHNTAEGKYWNPTIDGFTENDWREKVREIAAAGMEYIVIMATALYEKCYFRSAVYPFAEIPCTRTARRYGTAISSPPTVCASVYAAVRLSVGERCSW